MKNKGFEEEEITKIGLYGIVNTTTPESTKSLIEKGGWDKMPGEERGGYIVARACADGLEVLMKK